VYLDPHCSLQLVALCVTDWKKFFHLTVLSLKNLLDQATDKSSETNLSITKLMNCWLHIYLVCIVGDGNSNLLSSSTICCSPDYHHVNQLRVRTIFIYHRTRLIWTLGVCFIIWVISLAMDIHCSRPHIILSIQSTSSSQELHANCSGYIVLCAVFSPINSMFSPMLIDLSFLVHPFTWHCCWIPIGLSYLASMEGICTACLLISLWNNWVCLKNR
jgi:hypothetical protein